MTRDAAGGPSDAMISLHGILQEELCQLGADAGLADRLAQPVFVRLALEGWTRPRRPSFRPPPGSAPAWTVPRANVVLPPLTRAFLASLPALPRMVAVQPGHEAFAGRCAKLGFVAVKSEVVGEAGAIVLRVGRTPAGSAAIGVPTSALAEPLALGWDGPAPSSEEAGSEPGSDLPPVA